MRNKHDRYDEIDRLNKRIDAVIGGWDLPGEDEETRLLRSLARLDLSGESRRREEGRMLLLAMIKNQPNEHPFFGRLSQAVARRPYLAGACCVVLIAAIIGTGLWSWPEALWIKHGQTDPDVPGRQALNPQSSQIAAGSRDQTKALAGEAPRSVGGPAKASGDVSRSLYLAQSPESDNKGLAIDGDYSNKPREGAGAPATTAPCAESEQYYSSDWGSSGFGFRYAAPSGGQTENAFNTESYARIDEGRFKKALDEPLSTFSIDVDTASYANIRRFVAGGRLPPKDAVRIEEMINYFNYDYPDPEGDRPFSVTTEMAACPWNPEHRLVLIGLQGRRIDMSGAPPNNLVFLLDVSGSMDEPNKLPLLKASFRLVVDQLRPQDRVAIVVYAGAAGLVLPSTPGSEKEKILDALEALQAGGSTAGGAGIKLAYATAREYFNKSGNNRVILATDGDFNVGASSDAEMERLIEEEREDGIFLSVLGFGMGNYKDSKMEKLADRGNGNYAYIDSLSEARKVLVDQLGGTLLTIAKDVKIQVKFNPARVDSYRLIGYENRALANEDFEDDRKDAGELGAGHAVTALYEIIPAKGQPQGKELKYQQNTVKEGSFQTDEHLTVRLRYKDPDGKTSKLIERPLAGEAKAIESASQDFRFAAAVACFGMLLRDSEYKGKSSYELVLSLAWNALGRDIGEYRRGFLELVEQCRSLAGK